MQIDKITIAKTARVATLGNKESAKIGLLALHGYGQLIQFFIRKFHDLPQNELFVIAPEGFHRFYLEGTSGRVGASWMTKEERHDDISDNTAYLDLVYSNYFADKEFDKFVVLGFSQGAATAARWIEHTTHKIDGFIQWAGVFPPDLNIDLTNSNFKKMKHFFVVGNQDPYFQDQEKIISHKHELEEQGLNPELISFEGAHQIDALCLIDILRKI